MIFGAIVLVLAGCATAQRPTPSPIAARAQEFQRDTLTQLRAAEPSAVAVEFLRVDQTSKMLELVRKSPNVTVRLGAETVTRDNVNDVAARVDGQRQRIVEEMARRGFVNVAGEYDLSGRAAGVTNECRDLASLLRIVTITQEKAAVEFVDSSKRVIATGVVVGSSLAVRLGGRDYLGSRFLVGTAVEERMEVTFLDMSGLALGKPVSSCTVGVLNRRP